MTDEAPSGTEIVERWIRAHQEVNCIKTELNRAQTELANASIALGKWIVPSFAKEGEKLAVWYGDSLIQGEARALGRDPIITVRRRGETLKNLPQGV